MPDRSARTFSWSYAVASYLLVVLCRSHAYDAEMARRKELRSKTVEAESQCDGLLPVFKVRVHSTLQWELGNEGGAVGRGVGRRWSGQMCVGVSVEEPAPHSLPGCMGAWAQYVHPCV